MNPNQRKNLIYTLFLLTLMGGVYIYRNYIGGAENKPEEAVTAMKIRFEGRTMGTNYVIAYVDSSKRNLQPQIDSVLEDFNMALSTYIPTSEISQFNKNDSVVFKLPYFYPVMKRAQEIYQATNGAFNPTVLPLVEAWGFGRPDKKSDNPQELVDSLLQLVNMEDLELTKTSLKKSKPNISLDFSAIAKGNGIDVVAKYLESQNIYNYMVLIGGEANCKGPNLHGKGWMIGVDNPNTEEASDKPSVGYFWLNDKSIATSGNYRKFYIKDGKRFAHTINPKTGYPVEHNLLSATVFANNCTTADAYATAFMVMGKEKALKVLDNNPKLDAFLVFDEQGVTKTYITSNAKTWMVKK